MPVLRVVRLLGGHWSIIQRRAQDHARSIPSEGMGRSAYVDAVLFDLDPAAVDQILTLLHRRKLVCVRRSRGSVHIYGERPASIRLPKDHADVAVADLCSRIAAHMLGVGRAETLRQMAREAGDADLATERADEAMMHADRALTILRAHVARGVSVIALREALPLAFSGAAVAALTRREPRLALSSGADTLEESGRPVRLARLPSGMSETDKVLAHVCRSGTRGATRSDLMGAIRPKPTAKALSEIVDGLVAKGRVIALNGPTPVCKRGRRYIATPAP